MERTLRRSASPLGAIHGELVSQIHTHRIHDLRAFKDVSSSGLGTPCHGKSNSCGKGSAKSQIISIPRSFILVASCGGGDEIIAKSCSITGSTLRATELFARREHMVS